MASADISISEDEVPSPKDSRQDVHSAGSQENPGPDKNIRCSGTTEGGQGLVGQSMKCTWLTDQNQGQTRNHNNNFDGNQYCDDQAANPPEHPLGPRAPIPSPYPLPLASQSFQSHSSSQPAASRGRYSFHRGPIFCRLTIPPATSSVLLKKASVPGSTWKRLVSVQGPDLRGHYLCAFSDLRITNQRTAVICKQASGKGPKLQSYEPHRGLPDEVPFPGQVNILPRSTSSSDSDFCDLTVQEDHDGCCLDSLTQVVSDHSCLAALADPDAQSPVTGVGEDLHSPESPRGHVFCNCTSESYCDILNCSRSAGKHLPEKVGLEDIRFQNSAFYVESGPNLHVQVSQESPDSYHAPVEGNELHGIANHVSLNLSSQATHDSPSLQSCEFEFTSYPHGQVPQESSDQHSCHSHLHHRNQHQSKHTTQEGADRSCLPDPPGLHVWNPLNQGSPHIKVATREGHTLCSSRSGFHHYVHGHSTSGSIHQCNQATWSGNLPRSNASKTGPDLRGQVFQDCYHQHHQCHVRENSEFSHHTTPSYHHLWQDSTQEDSGIPSHVKRKSFKLHRNVSVSCDDVWCCTHEDSKLFMSRGSANGSGPEIPGKKCQHDPHCHPHNNCASSDLTGSDSLEEDPDYLWQQGQSSWQGIIESGSDLSSHATMSASDTQHLLILGGQDLPQQDIHENLILPSSDSGSHHDVCYLNIWEGPDILSKATLPGHVQQNSASTSGSDIFDQVSKRCPDHCLCLVWGDSDHYQCATPLGLNPWDLSTRENPDVPSVAAQEGQNLQGSSSVDHHDASLSAPQAEPDLCSQAPLSDHVLSSISSTSQPDVLEHATVEGLNVEISTTSSGLILGSDGPGSHADIQSPAMLAHTDASVSVRNLILHSHSSTCDCSVLTTQANPDGQHAYNMANANLQEFSLPRRTETVNPSIPPGLVFHNGTYMAGHNSHGHGPYPNQEPCHGVRNAGQIVWNNTCGSQHDISQFNVCTGSNLSNGATFPVHIFHSHSSGSHCDVQYHAGLAGSHHHNRAHLPCSILWYSASGSQHYIWDQAASHMDFSRNVSLSNHCLHDHINCTGQDTCCRATLPCHIPSNRGMRTDSNFHGSITQAIPDICIQANETVPQHCNITSGGDLNLCRSTSIPHNVLPVPGAHVSYLSTMPSSVCNHSEYPYHILHQQYVLGPMTGPAMRGCTTTTGALHHHQDNPPRTAQGSQAIRECSSCHCQVNHQAPPPPNI